MWKTGQSLKYKSKLKLEPIDNWSVVVFQVTVCLLFHLQTTVLDIATGKDAEERETNEFAKNKCDNLQSRIAVIQFTINTKQQ